MSVIVWLVVVWAYDRFLFVDWETFVIKFPVYLFDIVSYLQCVDSFEYIVNVALHL